jgi:hypothetical protein
MTAMARRIPVLLILLATSIGLAAVTASPAAAAGVVIIDG